MNINRGIAKRISLVMLEYSVVASVSRDLDPQNKRKNITESPPIRKTMGTPRLSPARKQTAIIIKIHAVSISSHLYKNT